MANIFLNLPVPAAYGVGASVDVSTLGAEKTFVIGGTFTSQIIIEASDDNTNFAPVWTFTAADYHTMVVPSGWLRIRQAAFEGGAATIAVGSNNYASAVATLVAPASTGTGAPTDVSALGFQKSVIVAGDFTGTIVIEISTDGVVYAPCLGFANHDIQYIDAYAQFMRVRRVGVEGGATPDVFVAAGNDTSAVVPGVACTAVLGFGNSNLVGTAEEFFALDPWFGGRGLSAALQGDFRIAAPRGGTLDNLFVRHNASDSGDIVNSIVYRVLVNGAPTALTVSLAAGTLGQVSDLVNTVSVAQGDTISMTAQMPVDGYQSAVVECIATMEFNCTILS